MNDVLLVVIALSVLTMAVIQVAAVVFAARTARRVGQLAERLEHDIRPIVANLQSITADAARTTAMASATWQWLAVPGQGESGSSEALASRTSGNEFMFSWSGPVSWATGRASTRTRKS